MPSRLMSGYQDFVFRFRHSPAAIAAIAGTFGLICGALFVAVFAAPSAPPMRGALLACTHVSKATVNG